MSHEWMRGRCWDMAIALAQITSLPLYGLYDDQGTCHHALVYDLDLQLGIDARGCDSIDALRRGCAGQNLEPLARKDIEEEGGWVGRPLHRAEIAEAVRYAKGHQLTGEWMSLREAKGLPTMVESRTKTRIKP